MSMPYAHSTIMWRKSSKGLANKGQRENIPLFSQTKHRWASKGHCARAWGERLNVAWTTCVNFIHINLSDRLQTMNLLPPFVVENLLDAEHKLLHVASLMSPFTSTTTRHFHLCILRHDFDALPCHHPWHKQSFLQGRLLRRTQSGKRRYAAFITAYLFNQRALTGFRRTNNNR
jgi:hypothetical protein